MGNVLSKFLMPMKKVYPLPKHALDQEDEFFEAYFAVLKTFDDQTLAEAAEHIIATRVQRTFPLPAECNLACAEAIKGEAIRARQEASPKNRPERRPFAEDAGFERADKLFGQCPYASRSLEEGWWWRLHSWIAEKVRIPDVHEAKIIRAQGMARDAQILEDIKVSFLNKQLIEWRSKAYSRISASITIYEGDNAIR